MTTTRHTPMLRWWLFMTIQGVLSYIAYTEGVMHLLWALDVSRLGLAIVCLYVVCSGIVGFRTWKIGRMEPAAGGLRLRENHDVIVSFDKLKQWSSLGWFSGSKFKELGLLGTVIGILIAVLSMKIGGGVEETKAEMEFFVNGIGHALVTTLIGIVCSILISVQSYHLNHAIQNR